MDGKPRRTDEPRDLRSTFGHVTVCNVTSRNRTTHRPLTDLQRAIIDFIAAEGRATADDIRAGLRTRHPLTDSSMRTLLRRLEARGLLSHTVEGKVFVYRAETSSSRVAAESIRRMIQGFWSGSAERFLAGLVDEKVLSAAEIQRLAKKIGGKK